MLLLKLYFHIAAIIKLLILRLCYVICGGKLTIGKHFTFRKGFSLMLDSNAEVEVGDDVFFNNYCSLNAVEKIIIGDGTIFGENVKIYDHNHCFKDINIPIKKQGYKSGPITIGKHCWIASNVVILKGVTIGDNCVIGAGCIIYNDVPSNTIVKNIQCQDMQTFKHISSNLNH